MRQRERLAWTIILIAFAAFCALAVAVPAGLNWVIQNITYEREAIFEQIIRGTPLVQEGGIGREVSAVKGMLLGESDQLHTPADAQALVSFADGSNVRLWPNTRLGIVRLRQTRFNDHFSQITVRLFEGHTRFEVALPGTELREFTVELPSAGATVRLREGSYSFWIDQQKAEIVVREGSASVVAEEGSVEVLRGERITVAPGQPLRSQDAERDLVANGNFATGDFASWQANNREVEDNVPGSVSLTVEDGRSLARFARYGSIRHGETFLHQQLNHDVTDYQSLRLSMEYKIRHQSLAGGGWLGSEYPLMVRLRYRDSDGNEFGWIRGLYIQNERNNPTNNGMPAKADTWERLVVDLFNPTEVTPRPAELLWIEIAASGWEYESYVTNVQLLAE